MGQLKPSAQNSKFASVSRPQAPTPAPASMSSSPSIANDHDHNGNRVSRVKKEVDSDEESALFEAEEAVEKKLGRPVMLPDARVRIKEEESDEERLADIVGEKDGVKTAVLNQNEIIKDEGSTQVQSPGSLITGERKRKREAKGDIKKEGQESALVKLKDEDDETVQEEELDEPAQLHAHRKDPRFDEEAMRLRDEKRKYKIFGGSAAVLTPAERQEQRFARNTAQLKKDTSDEMWRAARKRITLDNIEIREWYLSTLLYQIVNAGLNIASETVDVAGWKTLTEDLNALRKPLDKQEFEGICRQLDRLPWNDGERKHSILNLKMGLYHLSEPFALRFVESPSNDEEWLWFDNFRRRCQTWSQNIYKHIDLYNQGYMRRQRHIRSRKAIAENFVDVAGRYEQFALQLHKEPTGRKREASRLPAFAPASTTSAPSTMSITPPQNPIDLASPIVSPIPKRAKTSHNSDNNKMIPATTSEPNNVPVPVTKVQDGPHLLIKKLSQKAKLPTRGSAFAAGYDLYAAKETVVPARGKGLVDTDLSMAVPAGTYGRIAPRSGLAAKNFIDTGAGVIDADYRGQVKVLLFNHSDVDFVVREHDRVAQLILERIYTPEVLEVQELEESVRGEGGFGSTGVSIA